MSASPTDGHDRYGRLAKLFNCSRDTVKRACFILSYSKGPHTEAEFEEAVTIWLRLYPEN